MKKQTVKKTIKTVKQTNTSIKTKLKGKGNDGGYIWVV